MILVVGCPSAAELWQQTDRLWARLHRVNDHSFAAVEDQDRGFQETAPGGKRKPQLSRRAVLVGDHRSIPAKSRRTRHPRDGYRASAQSRELSRDIGRQRVTDCLRCRSATPRTPPLTCWLTDVT